MSSLPQEDVLVVPRSVLEQAGLFQGFCRDVEKYLPILLDRNQTLWMPREKAEEDPTFKQLIPYCLLAWPDPNGVTQFFPTRVVVDRVKHDCGPSGLLVLVVILPVLMGSMAIMHHMRLVCYES